MRAKCEGLTFQRGRCCAGHFSPTELLRTSHWSGFVIYCTTFLAGWGWLDLFNLCLGPTQSSIRYSLGRWVSLSQLHLPVGRDGITNQGARENSQKTQNVLSSPAWPQSLQAQGNGSVTAKPAAGIQLPQQELEPNRLTEIYLHADLSESTLCYLQ